MYRQQGWLQQRVRRSKGMASCAARYAKIHIILYYIILYYIILYYTTWCGTKSDFTCHKRSRERESKRARAGGDGRREGGREGGRKEERRGEERNGENERRKGSEERTKRGSEGGSAVLYYFILYYSILYYYHNTPFGADHRMSCRRGRWLAWRAYYMTIHCIALHYIINIIVRSGADYSMSWLVRDDVRDAHLILHHIIIVINITIIKST